MMAVEGRVGAAGSLSSETYHHDVIRWNEERLIVMSRGGGNTLQKGSRDFKFSTRGTRICSTVTLPVVPLV